MMIATAWRRDVGMIDDDATTCTTANYLYMYNRAHRSVAESGCKLLPKSPRATALTQHSHTNSALPLTTATVQ